MSPFDYLKIGVGVLAGAALVAVPACRYGQTQEREAAQIRESKKALERIVEMEENNENFLALPDRERCVRFMRDSRLPISNCD